MAFFALLWKARTIEKYRLNYERETINSIVLGNTQIEKTLGQKWRHYRYDTQKRISKTFKNWYPDGSGVANFILYLRTDQTFPNFLLKSVMGFVGGIVLTYLCFMFFVFQLSISLMHATIMSSTIGVLLTLGLAFSYRIRCLVFLLIPQLFSRVGRYTLTCYALVLILTGPATNTLKNSEVLTESMACSQEQIKLSVHQMNNSLKRPINSVMDSLKLMMERLQLITKGVRESVVKINRLVLSIVSALHSSFNWLKSIAENCNTKLGTPYERCLNVLKEGVADCRDALGPDYTWLCNVAYVANIACVAVKPYKRFCQVADFMDESIVATIKKKLRNFTEHICNMFRLEIHIQHSHSFSSNGSRSASQVAAGIVTEIRNRADPLLTWLSWSSCVTSLFLLLIIFRAKYYQHMYETRSRFDNRYMTRDLQELDLKRQRQGRETVLPLNRRERAKYITTTSFCLLASEKVNMNRSVVFMVITTFKLLIHMTADYSLYWVLMTIRYHGRFQSNFIPGLPQTGVHITGNGFVARLFRSVVGTLDIPLANPAPSPIPCLPNPYPPDLRRYVQIGVLICLLWFFALFEPYGLRLRHLVMGQYRPERAKARASWLYNHLLRTRASFMKFARRKLHREYKYSSEAHLTFRQWMNDHVPFQCLKWLLRVCPPDPHCLLCGLHSSPNDPDTQLTRCETPKCPGVYCTSCFSDIGQLCTICLSPADYGDLSDVSLERGSSDESSDSEAEPESTMRNPEVNDRPVMWSKVPENAHDEESINTKKTYYKSKIHYYKEKKMIAKNVISVLNVDENGNYTELTTQDVFSKKTLHQINKKDLIQISQYKNLYNFYHIISKECKITNDIKLVAFNYKIKERNTRPKRYYSSKRLVKKLSERFYDLTMILHKFRAVRRIKRGHRTKDNQKNKGPTNMVRHFMAHDETNNETKPKSKKESNKTNKIDNIKKTKPLKEVNAKKQKELKKKVSNKKPKKLKKQKSSRVKIKNSRENKTGANTFFSRHWRSITFSMLPCLHTKGRGDNETKDRKNHKHRKKRRSFIDIKESKVQVNTAKKDSKNTRNYRISAFLADLEWTKRDYGNRDKKKGDTVLQTTDCLSKSNNYNQNTIVGQVKSPPARWCKSPKIQSCIRHCVCSDVKCTCPKSESSWKISTPLTKAFAQKALKRFREKVKSVHSSSNIIEAKRSKANAGASERDVENEGKSKHLLRRLNYYNIMLKDDVDNQRIDRSLYPTELSLKIIPRRKFSLLGSNSVPKIEKNSATKNICEHIPNTSCNTAAPKSIILPFRKNKATNVFPKKSTVSTQDLKETLDVAQETSQEIVDLDKTLKSVMRSKSLFYLMRDFYSSMFGSSQKDEEEPKKERTRITAEQSIVAKPEMIVAACQYVRSYYRDAATQITSTTNKETEEKSVCGIQDAAVQYQRKVLSKRMKDANDQIPNDTLETYSSGSQSSSSTKTDETKTDTTVCSLATIDYNKPIKNKKYRVKVITKTNQSTLTDKTECHDISTYTNDWWSPILERKETKRMVAPKENTVFIGEKLRKHGKCKRKNTGIETDGKFVKFKSRTQIIPTGTIDVMSPSRYLLESQRYYNELFSYKFSPVQAYPVSQAQKNQDKGRSPVGSRRSHHHKTKRLEECYSPRKQMTPRRRHEDGLKRCDSPRWRQTSHLSRHKHK